MLSLFPHKIFSFQVWKSKPRKKKVSASVGRLFPHFGNSKWNTIDLTLLNDLQFYLSLFSVSLQSLVDGQKTRGLRSIMYAYILHTFK